MIPRTRPGFGKRARNVATRTGASPAAPIRKTERWVLTALQRRRPARHRSAAKALVSTSTGLKRTALCSTAVRSRTYNRAVRRFRLLFGLLGAISMALPASGAETRSEAVVADLTREIHAVTADFVARTIKEAEA